MGFPINPLFTGEPLCIDCRNPPPSEGNGYLVILEDLPIDPSYMCQLCVLKYEKDELTERIQANIDKRIEEYAHSSPEAAERVRAMVLKTKDEGVEKVFESIPEDNGSSDSFDDMSEDDDFNDPEDEEGD